MGVDYFPLPLIPSPQGRGKLRNGTLVRSEAIPACRDCFGAAVGLAMTGRVSPRLRFSPPHPCSLSPTPPLAQAPTRPLLLFHRVGRPYQSVNLVAQSLRRFYSNHAFPQIKILPCDAAFSWPRCVPCGKLAFDFAFSLSRSVVQSIQLPRQCFQKSSH